MFIRLRRWLSLVTLVGLFVVAVLALALMRQSNTLAGGPLVVTKTADTNDGACNSDCSLREAIIAANNSPEGEGDLIQLPAGTYALTIGGASENAAATGDLDITDDLTISGAAGSGSTIIDAGDLDRVLDVQSGTVHVSFVTLRNGSADYGGGVYISAAATLTLSNAVVSDNYAYGFAGGINNTGNLTLAHSEVTGNQAFGQTGGMLNNFGTATVNESTISGNTAGGSDGGLTNYNGATLTVTNSTISGNTAAGAGGGVSNGSGTMTITNSTISGNTAKNSGGGVYTEATTSLFNVTITDNTADIDVNGTGDGGGIYVPSWATATVKNTIIAGNYDTGLQAADCSGTLDSQGHNLVQDMTGCTLAGGATGDISGQPPLLNALMNNGGPTETHALQQASPAVDAGSADCPPPTRDQRGELRPQGAACDIGAYESPYGTPTPSPSPTPTGSPTPAVTATNTATPSTIATQTATPLPTATQTATPVPTPTNEVTATPSQPVGQQLIWGDGDCDGEITTRDNQGLLRTVLSQGALSQTEPCPDYGQMVGTHMWGDWDCDGSISTRDNQALLRFVLSQGALTQTEPCLDIGNKTTES